MSKHFLSLSVLLVALFVFGCGQKKEPTEQAKKPETEAKKDGVSGETFTNEAAKVSVNLPAGWLYETTEGGISASPEDGSIVVHFNTLQADQLDAALDEVDKVLASEVKDLKLGEATDYDVNGMSGRFVEGTADGVLVALGVVDTPVENLSLMVGAWGSPEAVNKYEKEIMYIFKNIKPVK